MDLSTWLDAAKCRIMFISPMKLDVNSRISALRSCHTILTLFCVSLGYLDTTDAVRKHIWNNNKLTVGEYRQKTIPGDLQGIPSEMGSLQNINYRTIVINEAGLYQLIFASKLEKAKEFQQWVFSEVLPSIRNTGSFQIQNTKQNQFVILNERNLHEQVVSYLRKYYPDVIFNASLSEMQDTSEKE